MKSYFSRKESIVITAIEIIDELGINALSIRELAARQGVSEPALYRHFKSKEEIILAILDYYCQYDSSIMNTIRDGSYNAKEGIIFFIKALVDFHESHPAVSSVTQSYEVILEDTPIVKKAKQIFESRSSFITYLVEKGQKEGDISLNIKSENLSDIILGTKRTIILKWRMAKYSFSLKERVLSSIQTLLDFC